MDGQVRGLMSGSPRARRNIRRVSLPRLTHQAMPRAEQSPERRHRRGAAPAAANRRRALPDPGADRRTLPGRPLGVRLSRVPRAASPLELARRADARRPRHREHAPEGGGRAEAAPLRRGDGLEGPTFRHAVDVRYKATRPPPRPTCPSRWRGSSRSSGPGTSRASRETASKQTTSSPSVTARSLAEGWRVVIVSADKDLMQLVRDGDERVVLWDSMRDRVYGPREVREKLGVPPSQVRDFLALTGDTSDNVPGVPGVGPKTAADLLAQFGSVDGIYANLEQVTKPKLRESLKTHEADARVSQKLVTLDASTPIEWDRSKLLWGGANVAGAPAALHGARVPPPARPARHARVLRARGGGGEGGRGGERGAARSSAPVAPGLRRRPRRGPLERIVARARSQAQVGHRRVGDERRRDARGHPRRVARGRRRARALRSARAPLPRVAASSSRGAPCATVLAPLLADAGGARRSATT